MNATVCRRLRAVLAGLGVALTASLAHAGLGLTQLQGLAGDGPVTVFYPSAAEEQPVKRGVFAFRLAVDAAPHRGNGRLVVISHGSGGAPWVHVDLARLLVDAGFTVALPEHLHDNNKDQSEPGPVSWARRPLEVSRAIDAVAADPRFAPLLAFERVGVFGGSAGGHTALSLAGGRWSPGNFRRHCEAHIADDFSSCVGYVTRLRGDWLDGPKKAVALGVIRQRFDDDTWHTHTDPRIAVAVAAVPFAADFDMASFAQLRVPLGLVMAGRDINQVPRFHVGAVRAACPGCDVLADLPEAGHGVMLSPLPPPEVMRGIAWELNSDPPGFDRATTVPALNAAITQYFRRHLLP